MLWSRKQLALANWCALTDHSIDAGKTVFALQTLVNGARQFGEPGIFVAFEENSRRILANAASFGWNLPKLEKKQLFFFDAKMGPDVIKAGEFDLTGMLAGIKTEANARGARPIVFDAVVDFS